MLQLLDDGQVTDSKGNKVDFKNCIVIFPSNVGSKDILDLQGDQELIKERVTEAMKKSVSNYVTFIIAYSLLISVLICAYFLQFRPEFLNRIDENIIFNSLSKENLRDIVILEARRLESRLAEKSMSMIVTDEALDFLAEVGFDPVYGARPLKRTMQKNLENPIAIGILGGDYSDGDTIVVGIENDRIGIRKAQPWEIAASDETTESSYVSGGFY